MRHFKEFLGDLCHHFIVTKGGVLNQECCHFMKIISCRNKKKIRFPSRVKHKFVITKNRFHPKLIILHISCVHFWCVCMSVCVCVAYVVYVCVLCIISCVCVYIYVCMCVYICVCVYIYKFN